MSDDLALVRRCLDGDEAGVREFIDRFQGLVMAVCWRMLGQREDAEDVAQEVFARAFRHLDHWDGERPLRPWVLTIAANRCRTALEKRSKRPVLSEAVEYAPERLDHSGYEREEVDWGEELQLALTDLRDDYRQVFVLFHQQELSYEEISEVLQCPIGTVRTWLHRARAQLSARFRERGLVEETET